MSVLLDELYFIIAIQNLCLQCLQVYKTKREIINSQVGHTNFIYVQSTVNK